MNIHPGQVEPVTRPSMQRTFGRGRMSVKQAYGRTRIDRLYQEGAARIRVPDHPDREDLEAIIINTAGGVTGGDDLGWDIIAGPSTHLTVTTQACEKIYKADETTADVNVKLTAAKGACLNWLPQETILFDCARLARTIEVDLAGDSSLLLVEPVIFGRRAMNETVEAGAWSDTWRIHHKGRLIHAENVYIEGAIAEHLDSIASLDGQTALATIAVIGNHAEGKLAMARAIIDGVPNCVGGASFWTVADAGKLVVRLAAPHGYALREALVPLINHLAPSHDHSAPVSVPKIWSL